MQPSSIKSRSPNLDDPRIYEIVKTLDEWTDKLTWELLAEKIEIKTGIRYTRQTLDRQARIKMAYQVVKKRISSLPGTKNPLTKAQTQKRLDNYDRLEAEVSRLNHEQKGLLDQIVMLVYNGISQGLTKEQLYAPLPNSNRGQTNKKN